MNATLTAPKGSTFTPAEFKRCYADPAYFVDAYGWTFDPRPEAYPHHLPFKLYPYQRDALLWIVDHIERGQDGLVEKSRDMGVSWLVLYAILWFWLFKPGFQAHIGSRKEDEVDDSTMKSLFPKLEYALDRLPFAPEGFDPKKHRARLKLFNPMNGNVVTGESSNANFARGGRFRVVLFDEGAFWDEIASAWPSAGDSTPCRLMVTTPPQKPNFAKYVRFSGKTDVLTLHWKLHPKKGGEWYEKEKARRSPEELAREVDINWEGSVTGRVYPEVAHVRLGSFPYRPDWPLWVAHDPGHHPDPYALTWWQVNPDTGRYRLLEAFEKRDAVTAWFLPFFGKPLTSDFAYSPEELALIGEVSQWKRGAHVGDQAGRQKESTSGESPYSEFAKHGIYVASNTKANDLETRKRYARRVLMNLDVNGTEGTRYFLECVKNARYPDLSENSNRVTPNAVPIHDWTSHMRTAMEFFAVNVDLDRAEEEPEIAPGTFMEALASVQSGHIPND